MTNHKFTFVDIFAGCGGLTYGFYKHRNFKGLLALDSWNLAEKVFVDNFPNMPFELGDLFNPKYVKHVSEKLKGKCDILLGGPPCQAFSTLGKRRDGDRRSSLVEMFVQICLNVKPKIIIMENVRGISSKNHKSGLNFPDFIRSELSNGRRTVKYNCRPILVKTLDYGLAQTRIRWILIAVRADWDKDNLVLGEIINRIKRRRSTKIRVLKDVIGDLDHIECASGPDEVLVIKNGVRKSIYNHKSMNHSPRLIERFSYVPVGGGLLDVPRKLLTNHLKRMIDGAYGNGGHIKNIYGRLDWNKPAGTIVAGIDKITCGRFVHPSANRLLTPRECARIQSFPDAFRFSGSLVGQYYLIGNAVPPKISSILANAVADSLRG